ncbi:flavin-containing monooxygenase [Rhodococcus sp. NPDC003318]|uniref:flavin-containing monooxygenase n=1 Tax=Rhodococcus sp. NPDC003318 TaxID=3364503 RepID=UPI0036C41825
MSSDDVDVLIVGAGLSGIGAACHLRRRRPGSSILLLEGRDRIGGTWDLFRYPGVRSDSDMYTLGYAFRPWTGARSITDGESILDYIRATAAEYRIEHRIRFGTRVTGARWNSAQARWTVSAVHDGTEVTYTCGFLLVCSGYYDYRHGYRPDFAGLESFRGAVVHPQQWDPDLDYAGRQVVVVGSGATAVTLVPAMARSAAHVTMLQRSPGYVLSLPARDRWALRLGRVLPSRWVYGLIRWKNVLRMSLFYELSRRRPTTVKRLLRKGVRARLGTDYDLRHFTPRYEPWDQRMCFVPDGDLFAAIRSGRASVVTDTVESFTPSGIRLGSGAELAADVVVTATGLELLPLGGIEFEVDGVPVDVSRSLAYKAMMLDGVPNLAFCIGYTNASWTLKCDLTCDYVCRLLDHMDARGYRQCRPRNTDPAMPRLPAIDFTSGYIRRGIHRFPDQGPRAPWRLRQNYLLDIAALRFGSVSDGAMEFTGAGR